jgi:hypothetical protein
LTRSELLTRKSGREAKERKGGSQTDSANHIPFNYLPFVPCPLSASIPLLIPPTHRSPCNSRAIR